MAYNYITQNSCSYITKKCLMIRIHGFWVFILILNSNDINNYICYSSFHVGKFFFLFFFSFLLYRFSSAINHLFLQCWDSIPTGIYYKELNIFSQWLIYDIIGGFVIFYNLLYLYYNKSVLNEVNLTIK